MKKIIVLIIGLIFSIHLFAKKKNDNIVFVKGFYTYQERNNRVIGNVYELTVKTLKQQIKIDSLWFDGKPVPCDVYETIKLQKVTTLEKGKTYLIKGNKDLYKNFFPEIAKQENAEVAHNWDVNIMYWVNNKRYFLPLKNIPKQEAKQIR